MSYSLIKNFYSTENFSPKATWYLRGIEDSIKLSDTNVIQELWDKNNYFPISNIFLPSEIRYITYIQKSHSFFFTTYDNPSLIKVQYCCVVNEDDETYTNQIAEELFTNKNYASREIKKNYNILALSSSSRFSLGNIHKYDISKIKFLVAESSKSGSRDEYIFIYGMPDGNVYTSKIDDHKDNIELNTISKLQVKFSQNPDILLYHQKHIKADHDYMFFMIADKKHKKIYEYHHSTSKKKESKLINDIVHLKNYNISDVCCLSCIKIVLKELSISILQNKKENKKSSRSRDPEEQDYNIDCIYLNIITSSDTIWTLHKHNGIQLMPLMGGAPTNNGNVSRNMLNYDIDETDTICIPNDEMIILGKKDGDNWNVLMLPQNIKIDNRPKKMRIGKKGYYEEHQYNS